MTYLSTTTATPTEAAEYLGVSPATLGVYRHRETGPRFTKEKNRIFYRWDDLKAWADENPQKEKTTTKPKPGASVVKLSAQDIDRIARRVLEIMEDQS